MRYLTIALAKGRLASKTMEMLEQLGITCEEMKDKTTRKLIFTNEELKLKFFLAKAGDVVVNDLFKIYPYENQLFMLSLTGKEIKDYLEYSYGDWLAPDCREHLLGIQNKTDERTGNSRWSLTGRSYNFDSAAGIIYTVNINKPQGKRIHIQSMADGSTFYPDKCYLVAMTSYRATGGGDLLIKGAGIPADELSARVVSRHIEIRELIKRFFSNHQVVTPESVSCQTAVCPLILLGVLG